MEYDIAEFEKLLVEFEEIPIKELRETTFLEIVNRSHIENVWSRILAFYLSPNKEHKLYELLLKSIFDAMATEVEFKNLRAYKVHTEYATKKGRIDIVIEAPNYVMGIENKVNAQLYNDLEDYSNSMDDLLKKSSKKDSYKIVLSKYPTEVGNKFVNITYQTLIKFIKKNIGNYYSYASTKYLVFFLDFIDNIEKNLNLKTMINNKLLVNFLRNNSSTVKDLIKAHGEITGALDNELYRLCDLLKRDSDFINKFQQDGSPYELNITSVTNDYDNCHVFYLNIMFKEEQIICFTIYIDESDYRWSIECAPNDKFVQSLGNILKNGNLGFKGEPDVKVEDIALELKENIIKCIPLLKNNETELIVQNKVN